MGTDAGVTTSGVVGVITGEVGWGSTNISDARFGNSVLIFLPTDGANGADLGGLSVFSVGSLW